MDIASTNKKLTLVVPIHLEKMLKLIIKKNQDWTTATTNTEEKLLKHRRRNNIDYSDEPRLNKRVHHTYHRLYTTVNTGQPAQQHSIHIDYKYSSRMNKHSR